MLLHHYRRFSFALFVVLALSACSKDNPPQPPLPPGSPFVDPVMTWNGVLLDVHARDHSQDAPEQAGPTRTSRAFAIVHLAVFDALNSIYRRFTPYHVDLFTPQASPPAAVAAAAYHTLIALFPRQKDRIEEFYRQQLSALAADPGRETGLALGADVAARILALRANDNANLSVGYTPNGQWGNHNVDPLNPNQGFLHPHWGIVRPFGIANVRAYLPPPPPPPGSAEYARAHREVYALGGNGINTPTSRTLEQLHIGLYWAYDGTPGLGTPPRLYNQIARVIAGLRGNDILSNARMFALVNVAMADAGIQCWDAKYFYAFWRPVLGLRSQTPNDPSLPWDSLWTPFGAPLSNKTGSNFTPNFPAYPSGHATFGAALFRILENFYGTDNVPFGFISDELNGVTTDNAGNVRPLVYREFHSLRQAAEENGQSRIYLGIHWEFDKTAGNAAGAAIADEVFGNLLRPL